jgi:hypothetical protein
MDETGASLEQGAFTAPSEAIYEGLLADAKQDLSRLCSTEFDK